MRKQDIIYLRDISDEYINIILEEVSPFLNEKQNIAFVAKCADKIIGLLFGYLDTIYVRPDFRKKGIAQTLAKYCRIEFI